jgi:hypothetical protein
MLNNKLHLFISCSLVRAGKTDHKCLKVVDIVLALHTHQTVRNWKISKLLVKTKKNQNNNNNNKNSLLSGFKSFHLLKLKKVESQMFVLTNYQTYLQKLCHFAESF